MKSNELGLCSSLDSDILRQYLNIRPLKHSPSANHANLFFSHRSKLEQGKGDRHKTERSDFFNEYNFKKLLSQPREFTHKKPLSQLTEEMRRIYDSFPKRIKDLTLQSSQAKNSEQRSNGSYHQNSSIQTFHKSKAKNSSVSSLDQAITFGSQNNLFDSRNVALQKSYNESYFQEPNIIRQSVLESEAPKTSTQLHEILLKTQRILQSYKLKEKKWMERESQYMKKILKLEAEINKLK